MSEDKPWPSRFGELGEKVFGKDDPFNHSSDGDAKYRFTSDEIPPTRSPITGKYYTSAAALRREYKAHGAEEIGTAYEHGYDPQKAIEKEVNQRNKANFTRTLHEYARGDRKYEPNKHAPVSDATAARYRALREERQRRGEE